MKILPRKFRILEPLELLTRMKSAFFVKSSLIFDTFYCFCIFINIRLFQKKPNRAVVEDMKFPGVLRKWQVEFQGLIS